MNIKIPVIVLMAGVAVGCGDTAEDSFYFTQFDCVKRFSFCSCVPSAEDLEKHGSRLRPINNYLDFSNVVSESSKAMYGERPVTAEEVQKAFGWEGKLDESVPADQCVPSVDKYYEIGPPSRDEIKEILELRKRIKITRVSN